MVPLWKWPLKTQYNDLKAGPRNIISRAPKRNYVKVNDKYLHSDWKLQRDCVRFVSRNSTKNYPGTHKCMQIFTFTPPPPFAPPPPPRPPCRSRPSRPHPPPPTHPPGLDYVIYNKYFLLRFRLISLNIVMWLGQREEKKKSVYGIKVRHHDSNVYLPYLLLLSSSGFNVTDVWLYRARIFKRLWSPGIDSKEWIPPAYVACGPVR